MDIKNDNYKNISINKNLPVNPTKTVEKNRENVDETAFMKKLDEKRNANEIKNNSSSKSFIPTYNNLNIKKNISKYDIATKNNDKLKNEIEYYKKLSENSNDPIREQKVAILKEKIRNKEYKIDLDSIVNNLLNKKNID